MSSPSKIAIIGGSGKMGRWFARFLLNEGKQVRITGRDQQKLSAAQRELGVEASSNIEAVKWAEIILVSVSIDSFEAIIKEISPYVQPAQVVIDITSVKEMPVAVMHRYLPAASVLGTHPVFGPGATDIRGQNIVLTPTSASEEALASRVKSYLETRGATVTVMTPRQHDELMTFVLGLSHFISLVSADTLATHGNLELLRSVSGNTYRSLIALVKSVISEDPQLYSYLQMNLPGIAEVEKLFAAKAKLWADFAGKKDRPEFIRRMKSLKDTLDSVL